MDSPTARTNCRFCCLSWFWQLTTLLPAHWIMVKLQERIDSEFCFFLKNMYTCVYIFMWVCAAIAGVLWDSLLFLSTVGEKPHVQLPLPTEPSPWPKADSESLMFCLSTPHPTNWWVPDFRTLPQHPDGVCFPCQPSLHWLLCEPAPLLSNLSSWRFLLPSFVLSTVCTRQFWWHLKAPPRLEAWASRLCTIFSSSCLQAPAVFEFLFWRPSMMDRNVEVWSNKPSPPQHALVITAVEVLTGTAGKSPLPNS